MDPHLFQVIGPADIRGFIEARLKLDHHRYVLAVLGGFDEEVDDLGLRGGSIQSDLDGKHLGVTARLLKETLYRGRERLVGMLHKQRAMLADGMKDIRRVREQPVVQRMVWRIAQVGPIKSRDLEQIPSRHQPFDFEYVAL